MNKIYDLPYFHIFQSRIVPRAFEHFSKEHPYVSETLDEYERETQPLLKNRNEEERIELLKKHINDNYILLYDFLSHFEEHFKNDSLKFNKGTALKRNKSDPFVNEILDSKIEAFDTPEQQVKFLLDEYYKEKTRLSFSLYLLNTIKKENILGINLSKLSLKFKVVSKTEESSFDESDAYQLKTLIFVFSEHMAEAYLSRRSLFDSKRSEVIVRKKA